jgi:hypothetical protein
VNAVVADQPQQVRGIIAADQVTPAAMISLALQNGLDIQRLEKLMELQERWEANQARKAFEAAMASAKGEIRPIIKNRTVDFTSARGRTNYDYEDFAAVADGVDSILAKHGLNYRHRPRQDGKSLTIICKMAHRDGHFEEIELTALNDESGNKNGVQGLGSTATYLQRYTVKLALGLAATKDDDGRAGGKPEEKAPDAPEGYADWRADMTAKADEGYEQFSKSWKTDATQSLRAYALKHDAAWRQAIINKAQAVDAEARLK